MEHADSRRWRKALRRLGQPAVRALLQRSDVKRSPESEVSGVVDHRPHPSGGFVDAWYRDAVRRTHRLRHIRLNLLAGTALVVIIAGVLAVIFFAG